MGTLARNSVSGNVRAARISRVLTKDFDAFEIPTYLRKQRTDTNDEK